MSLRFDPLQRFACASCARCCRGHEIAVTAGEVETLRAARAERFFRESADAAEGAAADPFVAVPAGRGLHVIRRRADGSCGFLSAENRCRLHEALGAKQKPLTCRMFPFVLRPGTGSGAVLVASHACPSVTRGEGPRLGDQARELGRLARDWEREHAPKPGPLELAPGRALAPTAAEALRTALRSMLGEAELRVALARIARHLGDLGRWRALRLADDRRSEYVVLTSSYRAGPKPPPAAAQRPGLVSRLLFRGFLFTVLALRERRANAPGWDQRLRLLVLLLHAHGLFPGVAGVRLGAARGVRVTDDAQVVALVKGFLQQAVEATGGGRRSLQGELAVAAAQVQAALRLARMRAGLDGRREAGLEDVREGVIAAADLDQLDHGLAARLLTLFAGPPDDAFDRLAAELR
jgi:Fe-S-cluster containining protein